MIHFCFLSLPALKLYYPPGLKPRLAVKKTGGRGGDKAKHPDKLPAAGTASQTEGPGAAQHHGHVAGTRRSSAARRPEGCSAPAPPCSPHGQLRAGGLWLRLAQPAA